MAKKNKKRNNNKDQKEKASYPVLTNRLRKWIEVISIFLFALIIVLSFFDKSGLAGETIFKWFHFLIGKSIFFLPLFLILAALILLCSDKKRLRAPISLGLILTILGISGILATHDLVVKDLAVKNGGWVGYLFSSPILKYFGSLVANIIFLLAVVVGVLIFWEFLPHKELIKKEIAARKDFSEDEEEEFRKKEALKKEKEEEEKRERGFRINKIKFPVIKKKEKVGESTSQNADLRADAKNKEISSGEFEKYNLPPVNLLESNHDKAASAGDIKENSYQIKKTLRNFGIPVEMSEVNIGPTVTQYTLKPSEGIKLSRITALANDLALSLAAHPIRIEAPIPGKSLVGIEIPNKARATVRLKELIDSPNFKESPFPLTFSLGKDVSGNPVLADLGKMPHLLVAGSTGSGKTICLNSIILSLLYKNSPRVLRLLMIDPKRVEFPIYEGLPHLLGPIIYKPHKAVNLLNWLVGEMERRFEILSSVKARDINSYNNLIRKNTVKDPENAEIMPYIVLIIDELADLMAAKGREVEAGIVRLSQMARAVGIHLIVATQRPSVEVITGLIKANITSRIAFQVASQVDSRTILDGAGAETLLGRGDMLFISSQLSKPKRIQGAYISSREIKKVVSFCKREASGDELKQENLEESLEKELSETNDSSFTAGGDIKDEPLYQEAKQLVIESNKASASLLQRRLRVGYARAARILDILEEKGVVGPAEGAKPRKVFGDNTQQALKREEDFFSQEDKEDKGNVGQKQAVYEEEDDSEDGDNGGWQKV